MDNKVYYEDWEDSQEDGLRSDFSIDEEILKDCNILYAYYSYQDYSGTALVIFERLGQLYEVHGSHCSCYDLEGQWEPEETTLESLARQKDFNLSQARDFIDQLLAERNFNGSK